MGEFDLKRWQSLAFLVIILAGYGAFTYPEIFVEKDYPDFDFYGPAVQAWQPSDVTHGYSEHLRMALGKLSWVLFQNYKVIPFLLSIGTIGIVYLYAIQLSKKQVAGPIGAIIVSTSVLFRFFDTSAVYNYSWVLFYMAALYFVEKKWFLSPVMFAASLLCKPIILLFLPSYLYIVFRSTISFGSKMVLALTYLFFGVATMALSRYVSDYQAVPFNLSGFVEGLYDWFFFLFADVYMAVMIPMMMILMLAYARKKIPNSGAVLASLVNVAFVGALLEGLTDDIWNEPYRYVPLVTLFGSGMGLMIWGFYARLKQKAEHKNLSESNNQTR